MRPVSCTAISRRVVPALWTLALLAGTPAMGQPVAEAPPEAATEPAVDAEASALSLADFDRAWELVRDTHFDPNYNGVDWDAVRDELRPDAAQAQTSGQRRAVITRMLATLKQSHFGIIPKEAHDRVARAPDAADADDSDEPREHDADAPSPEGEDSDGAASPGFELRISGDGVLITQVRAGSPADQAGLRPGFRVTRLAGRDLEEIIGPIIESLGEREGALAGWQYLDELVRGRAGTAVRVAGVDAADAPVEVTLTRAPASGQEVKFGNLPPMYTELTHRWLSADEAGGAGAKIGYIAFNIWMIPIRPQFERAMWELREADALVIDIRGNLGGIGGMSGGIAGFFVSTRDSLGTMRMRSGSGTNEINFNAQPVRVTSWGEAFEPFDGPVALLIDGVSASTSEIFAAGLQSMGRARVFGQTSAGAALPALMSPLPSGDVLLHAMADFHTPSGEAPEGGGVEPDEEIPLDAATLRSGRDATLEAAARWAASQAGLGS